MPVSKTHTPLKIKNHTIQQLNNYAFTGTIVSNGEATGVIITTDENIMQGKAETICAQHSGEILLISLKLEDKLLMRLFIC